MAVSLEATRASALADELYRAHERDVYRYALAALGNPADAEDVTQTTFMNALRALERGEQPRSPEGWLIAIAHNLVRERYRRARTRPLEVALEPEAVGAPPEEDQTKPSVDEVVRAMARIPESQRSALVMREFEGRSYTEIARTLSMTTSALETLLFRARRSLAEELENVMTCARAEADLAGLQAKGLSRKERRRLDEHVRECPACARLAGARVRRPRMLERALLLLPLPARLFRGAHATSSGGSAVLSGAAAAGSGGAATAGGGVVLGGLAAKVAVVATTAAVAGVGYVGISHVTTSGAPPRASHRAPQAATRLRSHTGAGGMSASRARTHASLSSRNAIGPTSATEAILGSAKRGGHTSGRGTPAGGGTAAGGAPGASGNAGASTGSGSVGKTATANAPPAAAGKSGTRSSGGGTYQGKSATTASNGKANANGHTKGNGPATGNGTGQSKGNGQATDNGQAQNSGQANGSTEPSTAPAGGSGRASRQTTTTPAESGQPSQGGSNDAVTSNGQGKGSG
jgi:RNA polymerase sigma factor (sigma-70 family)